MKVIFHIGTKKTGTTTIQTYLSRKRKTLQKKGICYPSLGGGTHHAQLVWSCLNDQYLEQYNRKKRIFTAVNEALKEIQGQLQKQTKVLLISAEHFSLYPPELFTPVFDYFKEHECYIIIYLREQNSYLASEYGQQVVHGRSDSEFSDFTLNYYTRIDFLNYFDLLNSWTRLVKKENIIVRPFEKGQRNEDLVKDFFTTAGIERFYVKQEYPFINRSFSFDAINFMKIANKYFKRNNLRSLLITLVEQHFLSPIKSNAFLTEDYVRDIKQKYEESNSKVAEEYLYRKDRKLFLQDVDIPPEQDHYQRLDEEKLVKLFIEYWQKEEFRKKHHNKKNTMLKKLYRFFSSRK